jgi:ankyrin repeat protein
MTPLFSAAESGHADIVMSLIEQGADIHVARKYVRLSSLALSRLSRLSAPHT